ncbi:hypothetical protein ACTFIW_006173 [Dictyostelium discoideum]
MEIGVFDILYKNEDGSYQQWEKKHITLNQTNFIIRNNEFDELNENNNFITANIIIVFDDDNFINTTSTTTTPGEIEMQPKQIFLKIKTNYHSNSVIIILIPSQELFDRCIKIINSSKNNIIVNNNNSNNNNNINNNNNNINNNNNNNNKQKGNKKSLYCYRIFFGLTIFYTLIWVGIFVALWFSLVTKNNFIGVLTKCQVNSVTKQNTYQKSDEAGGIIYYYDISYNVTYPLINSTQVVNSEVIIYEKGCCRYSTSNYDCYYDEDDPKIVVFDHFESVGRDIKSIFSTFGTLALPLIVLFLVT